MIIVNAKFQVKPEKKDEFLSDIKKLITYTKAELGNLAYDLYQETEDENSFIMVENWEDESSAQAHSQSLPFLEFSEKVASYSARKPELKVARMN